MKRVKTKKFNGILIFSILVLTGGVLLLVNGLSWGDRVPPSIDKDSDYRVSPLFDKDWDDDGTELIAEFDVEIPSGMDLDVDGDFIFLWDYDSGWYAISEGQTSTLNHNLGGDPDEYFVYFEGRDAGESGRKHNGRYGTARRLALPQCWYGAEWHDLTSTQIQVTRGDCDNQASGIDYDYVRIFILKNQ